jgi:hypothetical protein
MWGHGQHTLLGIVVGLLKYVGPQATHLTGYCYWFMWGLRQHTLLGIVVGFVWGLGQHFTGYCCLAYVGLGQHTLLGIVVGLCGASGNTIYWVLL